jgi:hypothetical protein
MINAAVEFAIVTRVFKWHDGTLAHTKRTCRWSASRIFLQSRKVISSEDGWATTTRISSTVEVESVQSEVYVS